MDYLHSKNKHSNDVNWFTTVTNALDFHATHPVSAVFVLQAVSGQVYLMMSTFKLMKADKTHHQWVFINHQV